MNQDNQRDAQRDDARSPGPRATRIYMYKTLYKLLMRTGRQLTP